MGRAEELAYQITHGPDTILPQGFRFRVGMQIVEAVQRAIAEETERCARLHVNHWAGRCSCERGEPKTDCEWMLLVGPRGKYTLRVGGPA